MSADVVKVCGLIDKNGGKCWRARSRKCAKGIFIRMLGGKLECGVSGVLSYQGGQRLCLA